MGVVVGFWDGVEEKLYLTPNCRQQKDFCRPPEYDHYLVSSMRIKTRAHGRYQQKMIIYEVSPEQGNEKMGV